MPTSSGDASSGAWGVRRNEAGETWRRRRRRARRRKRPRRKHSGRGRSRRVPFPSRRFRFRRWNGHASRGARVHPTAPAPKPKRRMTFSRAPPRNFARRRRRVRRPCSRGRARFAGGSLRRESPDRDNRRRVRSPRSLPRRRRPGTRERTSTSFPLLFNRRRLRPRSDLRSSGRRSHELASPRRRTRPPRPL